MNLIEIYVQNKTFSFNFELEIFFRVYWGISELYIVCMLLNIERKHTKTTTTTTVESKLFLPFFRFMSMSIKQMREAHLRIHPKFRSVGVA